jgi:hypothetical protein
MQTSPAVPAASWPDRAQRVWASTVSRAGLRRIRRPLRRPRWRAGGRCWPVRRTRGTPRCADHARRRTRKRDGELRGPGGTAVDSDRRQQLGLPFGEALTSRPERPLLDLARSAPPSVPGVPNGDRVRRGLRETPRVVCEQLKVRGVAVRPLHTITSAAAGSHCTPWLRAASSRCWTASRRACRRPPRGGAPASPSSGALASPTRS